MAPRAGVPAVSITNGLDWQTAARGDFEPQRFSGEVANRHPSAILRTGHGPTVTMLTDRRVGVTRRANRAWQRARAQVGAEVKPQPALQAGRDSMALNRCTSLAPTGWPRSSSATAAPGSGIDATTKDSALAASIALQHGVPVDVIRKALLRDSQRNASSPLGAALDAIAEQKGGR